MGETSWSRNSTPKLPRAHPPARGVVEVIVLRLIVATGASASACLACIPESRRQFSGHSSVVGYPLYADFNVGRYSTPRTSPARRSPSSVSSPTPSWRGWDRYGDGSGRGAAVRRKLAVAAERAAPEPRSGSSLANSSSEG